MNKIRALCRLETFAGSGVGRLTSKTLLGLFLLEIPIPTARRWRTSWLTLSKNQFQAGVEEMRQLQMSLHKKPSLLQSYCREMEAVEDSFRAVSPKNQPTVMCSCSRPEVTCVESRSTFYESTTSHRPSCPLYRLADHTLKFGVLLPFTKDFFGRIVQLSFSFTWGAGGYSMCPCLEATTIVPWNAPAFSLLDEFNTNSVEYAKAGTLRRESSIVLQQLYRHFCDGSASPRDRDQFGFGLSDVRQ